MRSPKYIALLAAAVLSTSLGVACHDNPVQPRNTTARLTIVGDVQATGDVLSVRIAYHRSLSGGTLTEVLLQELNRALTNGQQLTTTLDLAPCLGDPQHVGGGACEIVIQMTLLDASGAVVDAVSAGAILVTPGSDRNIGPLAIGSQRLTITNGDAQVTLTGSAPLLPVVARLVSSATGAPLAGRTLAVSATSGGGAVSAPTIKTDAQGQAALSVVVGQTPGMNAFRVASTDQAGSAADVRVMGVAPPRAIIAAGRNWTCALDQLGAASCWGENSLGQLGAPQIASSTSHPAPVSGAYQFAALAASAPTLITSATTCALTREFRAYCWGTDFGGELGGLASSSCGPIADFGSVSCAKEPLAVQTDLTFTSISAGGSPATFGIHVCAVSTPGDAYCWGDNYFGQLGDGTVTARTTPVPVDGGLKFVQVNAGLDFTCGVAATAKIYCWGRNAAGQFGNGDNQPSAVPVPVTSAEKFVSVTTGVYFACGLTIDGKLLCWGKHPPSGAEQLTPSVIGGPTLAKVTAGDDYACGLTPAGAAYCVGEATLGQLGNGTSTPSNTLIPVAGGFTFSELTAGSHHTCGRTTGGDLYCWGFNADGQLGVGGTLSIAVPVRVTPAGASIGSPASIVAIPPTEFTGAVQSLAGYGYVRVTDANGSGVPNVGVRFAATSGGGMASGSQSVTDSSGVAFVALILGAQPGLNTYEATVATLPNMTASFEATGVTPGPVATITPDMPTLTAYAGTTLFGEPAVVVKDANGLLIAGAKVTFTHSASSDAVITPPLPATVVTDAFGHAAVSSWVLGGTPGVDTVTVTVAGSSATPAQIIVTTTSR